jgi:DNA repair protein RecN (Recombination protein N)
MLVNLTVKNYAIIKEMDIEFDGGFCVITGETGAGKSIIMGALGVILGQRVDTSVLNDNKSKCIVEGRFSLSGKNDLKSFFEQYDLDFEDQVILRREIAPSGKSRAFVNDTPVQLPVMRALGVKLIDVHSQHSNLDLGRRQFQLNVIDWYGGNDELLQQYSGVYQTMRKLKKQRNELAERAEQTKADLDYFEFQFNQLDEVHLVEGEQEQLEQELELLTHSEEIKSGLNSVYQLLDDGQQVDALSALKEGVSIMQKISDYHLQAASIFERLNTQYIEMRDIADECGQLAEKIDHDPMKLEQLSDRLNTIYSLQQKHRVASIAELIVLKNDFDDKINTAASYDEELIRLDKLLNVEQKRVADLARHLHLSREKVLVNIEKEVMKYLQQLGMPNAIFKVELKARDEYGASGNDEVYFLFAANKGGQLEEINKVASGGELSRLMLAIKTVVAKSKALSSIIFDEIDIGISGEIAGKMGTILQNMANYMQVINITHLPQIASKGNTHYQVYKIENKKSVETGMRLLSNDERILEIAKMLSGDQPTSAAIENAKSLLGM